MKSKNIKKEQTEKIRQIFPKAVSEGEIDWEKLQLSLGEDIAIRDERYALNWAGKSDAFRVLQQPTAADGELVIYLSKLIETAVKEIAKLKPGKVICLDTLFEVTDQLKTNTALQMKDAEVDFRTICV